MGTPILSLRDDVDGDILKVRTAIWGLSLLISWTKKACMTLNIMDKECLVNLLYTSCQNWCTVNSNLPHNIFKISIRNCMLE
jgi:hypothetical protein